MLIDLATGIAEAGLAGENETSLVARFCESVVAAGLPLARATVGIDTLHPIYEGVFQTWHRATGATTSAEYARPGDDKPAIQLWHGSPFYRLLQTGEPLLRRRLTAENETEFNILPELRAEGVTDYVAIVNRIAGERRIGEMDCVYSSWSADRPAVSTTATSKHCAG